MEFVSTAIRNRSNHARTVPDLTPIMALHRHQDGYISFAVSDGDHFRPLISIRADELERYFPEFRDQLLKNSHVSVNAGYQVQLPGIGGRRGRSSSSVGGPALGYPIHRTDRLRYLCAAYADLDFYKLGLEFGDVLGAIIKHQDACLLPKASIIVRSGRGVWLLYLLRAKNDADLPPSAYPEVKEVYFRVQRALNERLTALGADPCAKDAARYVRVPGSFHSGAEEHVEWSIWGEGGSAYTYELNELAAILGVADGPRRHPRELRALNVSGPKNARLQAAGKRGYDIVAARRISAFNGLRQLRGGFRKGQPSRNQAAMIYAYLLRCNRVPRIDAASMLAEFAAECRPRLSHGEWQAAVKSGFQSRFITDQTIANMLDVTPGESATLDMKVMRPASRFGPTEPKPLPSEIRARTILGRREKIKEIIAVERFIPPVREMGRLLIEAGFRGNHQTVQKDYVALGIQSGRTKTARATEKSRQLPLSESRPGE